MDGGEIPAHHRGAEGVKLSEWRRSPADALRDLDVLHGDELLQLIQTVDILYLTAELGTVGARQGSF